MGASYCLACCVPNHLVRRLYSSSVVQFEYSLQSVQKVQQHPSARGRQGCMSRRQREGSVDERAALDGGRMVVPEV